MKHVIFVIVIIAKMLDVIIVLINNQINNYQIQK